MWGLLLIKEVRERSQVIQCLQQRAGSLNIKWLLLIKENQIFQVKEFSTFLCMGRCKSRLTEIIPFICTSASGASIQGLHTRSFLSSGLIVRSGHCVMAARQPVFSCPSSLTYTGGLQLLITVTSLFTDNGRKYFTSHVLWVKRKNFLMFM